MEYLNLNQCIIDKEYDHQMFGDMILHVSRIRGLKLGPKTRRQVRNWSVYDEIDITVCEDRNINANERHE